jgi:solute carrier family 25, member 34/35
MNGIRLGTYLPIKRQLPEGTPPFLAALVAGGSAGCLGALVGSPLSLCKVRMQAHSTDPELAVGCKHEHLTMRSILTDAYNKEGVRGLWRGSSGAVARLAMGSSVQLSSYDTIKRTVLGTGLFQDGLAAHFSCSFVTGFIVAFFMNPFDVISTRLYNQSVGKSGGALYSGVWDCLSKVRSRMPYVSRAHELCRLIAGKAC